MIGNAQLEWRAEAGGEGLYRRGGRGEAIVRIRRDARYSEMWRIALPGGGLSDMFNRTWAREGARALVRLNLRADAPSPEPA